MKAIALTLAALLAGVTAIPTASSVGKLATRDEVLSKIRSAQAEGLNKRQFGCYGGTDGQDEYCMYCMIFGYDDCCTVTDMTTGQTISDGCDYFGKTVKE